MPAPRLRDFGCRWERIARGDFNPASWVVWKGNALSDLHSADGQVPAPVIMRVPSLKFKAAQIGIGNTGSAPGKLVWGLENHVLAIRGVKWLAGTQARLSLA